MKSMPKALYARACRFAGKFGWLRGKGSINGELRGDLEFAALGVEAEDVVALSHLIGLLSTVLAIGIVMVIRSPSIALSIAPVPLLAYTFVGWYPKWLAERWHIRGSGEVPVLVNYLTMSMKVTPNLERATAFAAENLGGPLGAGLKDALRLIYLRVYAGIGEALGSFARRWGKLDDLKRSIYLIRCSVSERDEAARLRTLDRALELSLRGARDRMRDFVTWLHLPTSLIYSLGILLPLVLVTILPVFSVIGIGASTLHLFSIYCGALPLGVYLLGKWALAKRPATSPPPEVRSETNRVRIFLFACLLVGVLSGAGLFLPITNDLRAILLLWALTFGVVIYTYSSTARAFKKRARIKRMDHEFCDSLIQLGNRISEGCPAEGALEHIVETTRGSELADTFGRVSANFRFGGMGLRASILDPERGALSEVPSRTIRSVLRLLVDVIERSTRAAGGVILRMADHLMELKRIEFEIRRSLGEVVASMRSVALFFAPFVTSIAARMQGILASKTASVGFLSSVDVSPPAFLFVLGLYIILLTAILISYAVEIELGDDRVAKRMAIANALPVALGVFTAGAILGGQMLEAIIG